MSKFDKFECPGCHIKTELLEGLGVEVVCTKCQLTCEKETK